MVQQQWALDLNRRNSPGDRDKAVKLLETLISTNGPDPETLDVHFANPVPVPFLLADM
jgi:MAP3K TRAFs-binding domain